MLIGVLQVSPQFVERTNMICDEAPAPSPVNAAYAT